MPLEKDIEADADLATILGRFTNYIQNERVRAFNEGYDAGTAEERARCRRGNPEGPDVDRPPRRELPASR